MRFELYRGMWAPHWIDIHTELECYLLFKVARIVMQ